MLLAFYRMTLVPALLGKGHTDPYWLPKAKAVTPQFWEFMAKSWFGKKRRNIKREVSFRTSAHPRVLGNTSLCSSFVVLSWLFRIVSSSPLSSYWEDFPGNHPELDCYHQSYSWEHQDWHQIFLAVIALKLCLPTEPEKILKLCPGTRRGKPTGANWGSLVQGLPQREQGFSVRLLHSVY